MEERPFVTKVKENFTFFGSMSILYGILFTICMYQNLNGITFPILVAITILFGLMYVRRIGFQVQKDTWLYISGMIFLGISSVRTTNGFLIFFNIIGIFLLFLVMMVHQFYNDKEWNFQTCLKNIFVIIGTTIGSVFYPFQHAVDYSVGKSSKRRKTFASILIGIVIAFGLLLIILPLLVSSDQIFKIYFGKLASCIRFGNIFWICVMTGVMAVLSYAFFIALCKYNLKRETERQMEEYNPIVAITFTSVIAAIYLFYSVIQILYLFVGVEGGLPDGVTYSSYARSGFWELIFVSIINFLMVIICSYVFRESKVLKGVLTTISGCTFLMLVSAAYRMCMYVGVYHLTFLRVLVLWFLFLLALIMVGTVVSIYKKKFPLFRYIVFVTASCYIVFSAARPDAVIAKYNIEHTEDMSVTEFYDLLYQLSDDAAPVLKEMDLDTVISDGFSQQAKDSLREYFKGIQYQYKDSGVREWNYARSQALKSAEEYLK